MPERGPSSPTSCGRRRNLDGPGCGRWGRAVGLGAHDDNPDVAEHWERWTRVLPDAAMAPSLPTSEVVRAGEAEGFVEWSAWMRDRYRL